MDHPLIGGLDGLTEEQLSERILDLNRKLTIAMRLGNSHLCNQIRMALSSYQARQKYLQDQRNQSGNTASHFDKIDIS